MRLLSAIGRILARAIAVAFGAINAIGGGPQQVPPPELPERRRDYRP